MVVHLCSMLVDDQVHVGVLADGYIVDLTAAGSPGALSSMLHLIEAGDEGLCLARDVADRVRTGIPVDAVQLLAPIPRPRKNIVCVGRNYLAHAEERGATAPDLPVFFTKPPTAVRGTGATVPYPNFTKALDYEVELAVIIGKEGRNIRREDAMDYIFGYTIVNDLTARDVQRAHQQWFKGKGFDGSCPMGPFIVTKDRLQNPGDVALSLTVNGEIRQSASTSKMIFSIPDLIESLSTEMTLEPGDIIATGTPEGVGAAGDGQGLLRPGDVIRASVEGIGTLVTTIGPMQHTAKA